MTHGVKGSKSPHGTIGRYTNHGCRCDLCREAIRVWALDYAHRTGRRKPIEEEKARRKAAAAAKPCGTEGKYKWGCRCEKCRAASARGRAHRRQKAAA